MNNDKMYRVLGLYTKFVKGNMVFKQEEAQYYGVNEKSIQRDIEDIRKYLEDEGHKTGDINTIVYDRIAKGYHLEKVYKIKLMNEELLAICKILLDSRAFTKNEMHQMLQKLIECCVPEGNQKLVADLIRNEEFHYIEPQHKNFFLDKMWEIGQAIRNQNYIEVDYKKIDGTLVNRKLKPAAIMFSEYYFYMTAFIDDDDAVRVDFDVLDDLFPTIYRIDRIQKLKVLDKKYQILYKDRFEEGEFRKRIQFMYGGRLRNVKFEYLGSSIEAVLDRLPTAKIISECDGKYILQAEVFGDGIDMWIRSQGDLINIIN
ncbi:MAG: WYL domain-containing protein [Lachnospiraceae bacterium]|nr:WYL domain-containing protein [Lachnospiraceae bacterium]